MSTDRSRTRLKLAGTFALAVMTAGPATAQAGETLWLHCETTARSSNYNFVESDFRPYLRINGNSIFELFNPNTPMVEDSCNIVGNQQFYTRSCTINDGVIAYTIILHAPGDGDIRSRTMTINRRTGSFTQENRWVDPGMSPEPQSVSGTCRRIDDPRPPAAF